MNLFVHISVNLNDSVGYRHNLYLKYYISFCGMSSTQNILEN